MLIDCSGKSMATCLSWSCESSTVIGARDVLFDFELILLCWISVWNGLLVGEAKCDASDRLIRFRWQTQANAILRNEDEPATGVLRESNRYTLIFGEVLQKAQKSLASHVLLVFSPEVGWDGNRSQGWSSQRSLMLMALGLTIGLIISRTHKFST